jgi:hypothetical protein
MAGLYHFDLVTHNFVTEEQFCGIATMPGMVVKAESGVNGFASAATQTCLPFSVNVILHEGDEVVAFCRGRLDPLVADPQDPEGIRSHQFSGYLAVPFRD